MWCGWVVVVFYNVGAGCQCLKILGGVCLLRTIRLELGDLRSWFYWYQRRGNMVIL